MTVERLARARLLKVMPHGRDAGPCQINGCDNRAAIIVSWQIAAFGETPAWYCDEHAPAEAIEGANA